MCCVPDHAPDVCGRVLPTHRIEQKLCIVVLQQSNNVLVSSSQVLVLTWAMSSNRRQSVTEACIPNNSMVYTILLFGLCMSTAATIAFFTHVCSAFVAGWC